MTAVSDTEVILITFHGIATNASAAALSFETAYKITQEWASKLKKGSKNTTVLELPMDRGRLPAEKNSVCRAACQHEKNDLTKRVQAESEARQCEIDRL